MSASVHQGEGEYPPIQGKMADSDDDEDFVPSKHSLSYVKRKANATSTVSRAKKGKLPPPNKLKPAPSSPPLVASPSSCRHPQSQPSRSDRKAVKTLSVPKNEDVIILDDFDDIPSAASVSLPTEEGESCSSNASTHPSNGPGKGLASALGNSLSLLNSTGNEGHRTSQMFHAEPCSLPSHAQKYSSICSSVNFDVSIVGNSAGASNKECNGHSSTPEALGHLDDSDTADGCVDGGEREYICVSDDDDCDPEFEALLQSVPNTVEIEHCSSLPPASPSRIKVVSESRHYSSAYALQCTTTPDRSPSMALPSTPSPKQQSGPSSKQTSLLYYFKGHNTKWFIPNRSQSSAPFPKQPRHPSPRSHTALPPVCTTTSTRARSSSLPGTQVQYEPDDIAVPTVRSSCPFYKRVHGTAFTVDAFSYGAIPGCTAYFLSHFHSDHYRGLSSQFTGPIFCSKPTDNLVVQELKVSSRFIHTLTLDLAHDVQGVMVTLLEAHHCPGAVMFLFQLPCGSNILHTGDFRAHMSMFDYPSLRTLPSLKTLYLDTTYCDPQYSFPQQEEVVSFIVNRVTAGKKTNKRLLVVCGTYTIGKERIFLGIARALGCKAGVDKKKKAVLDCLEDRAVSSLLTTDLSSTCLHVLPMAKLTAKSLQSYLGHYSQQYSALLAVRPTGWTFGGLRKDWRVPQQHGQVTIYGVPYSEHSSVEELEMFVRRLKPERVIPTVGVGSEGKRRTMSGLIAQWTTQHA